MYAHTKTILHLCGILFNLHECSTGRLQPGFTNRPQTSSSSKNAGPSLELAQATSRLRDLSGRTRNVFLMKMDDLLPVTNY